MECTMVCTLRCKKKCKIVKYRFGAKLEIFESASKSILSHGLTRFPLSWIVLSVLSCLKNGGTTIVLFSISAINIDSLKPLSWLFGPYVKTINKDRKSVRSNYDSWFMTLRIWCLHIKFFNPLLEQAVLFFSYWFFWMNPSLVPSLDNFQHQPNCCLKLLVLSSARILNRTYHRNQN